MHMFFRSRVVAAAKMDEAVAHMKHTQAVVRRSTGIETTVSRGLAGLPSESLVLGARLDSFADYESYLGALTLNARDHVVDETAEFFRGPACDLFAEVVATINVGEPSSYELTITAQIDEDAFDEALVWGTEALEYIGNRFSCPIIFCHAPYGPGGHVRWCLGFETADEVEESSRQLFADAGYLDRLRASGRMFGGRSSRRYVTKRIDTPGNT